MRHHSIAPFIVIDEIFIAFAFILTVACIIVAFIDFKNKKENSNSFLSETIPFKRLTKNIYMIIGNISLIFGCEIMGFGLGSIFYRYFEGVAIGLGISLIVTSFICFKSHRQLVIDENKKAERAIKIKEVKKSRLREDENAKNADLINEKILNTIKRDFNSNHKIAKAIINKMVK
jgi:hypothetical protein